MRISALPLAVVAAALLVIWVLAAIALNWQVVADAQARTGHSPDWQAMLGLTLNHARPLLPGPHQLAEELWRSTVMLPVTSRRSLVHHAWITLSAALSGFALGSLAGIVLATAIVHLRTLERSLMPWIVMSQAVPVLALAPIVIVALGSLDLGDLWPKAVISAYLCFFPVTIGMARGLASPDRLSLDLMRTWSASRVQIFFALRLPVALPFLFGGLKVAMAASIVGAIVAELPTGAQAGLGARLLAGSYFGQTLQIWSALAMAALVSATLVGLLALAERLIARRMAGAA